MDGYGNGKRLEMRRGTLNAAATLAFALVWPAVGEATGAPQLGLPLDCEPGKTCWIVSYVDHDPTHGVRDYACGKATYNAPPDNRHKGTDFAIRDMAAMRRGVAVLAAAPGTVLGVRDGMKDVDVAKIGAKSVSGKECGNGVRIDNGSGWATQYCHMFRGSITVKKGERVKAGQALGLVGLSGLAQFPHLHVQVSKGREIVDPFVGLTRGRDCGPGESPLWRPDVLARLPYRPTALYNAGFANEVPTGERIREGTYSGAELARTAPVLILWVDMFRVQAGDQMDFAITGPDGKKLFSSAATIKKDFARAYRYGGLRKKGAAWAAGTYRGEITLIRKGPKGREEYSVAREVTLR